MKPPEVASSETRGLKVEGSPGEESIKTPPERPISLLAVSTPAGRGWVCREILGGGEQAEKRSKAQRAMRKTGCAIKMENKMEKTSLIIDHVDDNLLEVVALVAITKNFQTSVKSKKK